MDFYFMCMNILPVCMLVCLVPIESEEGVGSLVTMGSHEMPCGCQELSPDSLQEPQVLLTTEPFLHTRKWFLLSPATTEVKIQEFKCRNGLN